MTVSESTTATPAVFSGSAFASNAAGGEVYSIVRKAVFGYFALHFGRDEAQDFCHDTFILVSQALAKNQVRDLGSLSSFARTVAKRQRCWAITERRPARVAFRDWPAEVFMDTAPERHRPDHLLLIAERQAVVSKLFLSMEERQREVLRRFYLLDQTKEEICLSLGLTSTQFRLMKSRAKQLLADRVHAVLDR